MDAAREKWMGQGEKRIGREREDGARDRRGWGEGKREKRTERGERKEDGQEIRIRSGG